MTGLASVRNYREEELSDRKELAGAVKVPSKPCFTRLGVNFFSYRVNGFMVNENKMCLVFGLTVNFILLVSDLLRPLQVLKQNKQTKQKQTDSKKKNLW